LDKIKNQFGYRDIKKAANYGIAANHAKHPLDNGSNSVKEFCDIVKIYSRIFTNSRRYGIFVWIGMKKREPLSSTRQPEFYVRFQRTFLLRQNTRHLDKACRIYEVQLPTIVGISSLPEALDKSTIKDTYNILKIFIKC